MMLFSFPTSPENIMFCSSPLRCHANFCLSVVCDWQLARFANLTGGPHYGDRSKQTGTDTFCFFMAPEIYRVKHNILRRRRQLSNQHSDTFVFPPFSSCAWRRLDWIDGTCRLTRASPWQLIPCLLGCSCFQKKQSHLRVNCYHLLGWF